MLVQEARGSPFPCIFVYLVFSVWSYFTWASLLHVLHFRTHDVMPFLIYRDKMRAEGLNHYPYILGMALNQYRIDTKDQFLH